MEEQHTEIFQDFLAWADSSSCCMDLYCIPQEHSIFKDLDWLSSPRNSADCCSNNIHFNNYQLSLPNGYPCGENIKIQTQLPSTFSSDLPCPKDRDIGHFPNIDQPTDGNSDYLTNYPPLENRQRESFHSPCSIQWNIHSSTSTTLSRMDVCKMAKQKHGCQLLLHHLEHRNEDIIIEQCCQYFKIWMKHPIANFLCQRVWKCLSENQQMDVLKRCSDELPRMALHTYGTRVVQVMISTATNHNIRQYLQSCLSTIAKLLFKDVNGAHVIQHCFLYWSHEDNEFLYRAIQENFVELATHRQGCCMIQTSMDFASCLQFDNIVSSTLEHLFVLIHDAFGNYVVQHILDNSKYERHIQAIMRKLQGHWYEMSREKFSSNITEKCLQVADETTRWEMIDEIAKDASHIGTLLHDAYGNYVIQRMLQVASPPQKIRLKEWIEKYWNSLSRFRYGRQIQYNLEKWMT
jgi:hypothetical protein